MTARFRLPWVAPLVALAAWAWGAAELARFDRGWPTGPDPAASALRAERERRPLVAALDDHARRERELAIALERIALGLEPSVAAGAASAATDRWAGLADAVVAADPGRERHLEVRRAGRTLAWSGRARAGLSTSAPPARTEPFVALVRTPVLAALVACRVLAAGNEAVELRLFEPLWPERARELCVDADGPAAPGVLEAELFAQGGERWRIRTPPADREVARARLERAGRSRLVVVLGLLALALAAHLARVLAHAGVSRAARLAWWTAGMFALALGLAVLRARTGWSVELPYALDGQTHYSDGAHVAAPFTESPLALFASACAVLGWLAGLWALVRSDAAAGARPMSAVGERAASERRSVDAKAAPAPVGAALAIALGAVLTAAIHALFVVLTRSAVVYSYGVELFPDDRVVPSVPALALELALLILALATIAAADLACGAARRACATRRASAVALAVLLAAAAVPAGLAGWPPALVLYLAAGSMAVALACARLGSSGRGRGAAAWLFAALGAALLLHPALEHLLWERRIARARLRAEAGDDGQLSARQRLEGQLAVELDALATTLEAAPEGLVLRADAALVLWSGSTLPASRGALLLRILDAGGRATSALELGMPPAPWYAESLRQLEARADLEVPIQMAIRRGAFELSLLAQVRTVRTRHAGERRIALVMPLLDDPYLPIGAFPGMRLFAPEAREAGREVAIRRDGTGRIWCAQAVADRAIPSPTGSVPERVTIELGGRQAEAWVRAIDGGWLAFAVPRRDRADELFDAMRLVLLALALGAVALPFAALRRSAPARARATLSIERRLLAAFGLLSVLPLVWLFVHSEERGRRAVEATVANSLAAALDPLARAVSGEVGGGGPAAVEDAVAAAIALARRLEIVLAVYRGGELAACHPPDLATVGVLPPRLAFGLHRAFESGEASMRYDAVDAGGRWVMCGYAAVRDLGGGTPLVLSTVPRETPESIARDQVRATLGALAVYGAVLVAVMVLALLVARGIGRPVRMLLEGTRRLAAGDLEHQIRYGGTDEFGELVRSFNAMTARLKLLQEQRVDAGRTQVISTLARQVAHEIKNPLTPMKLAAQHLQDAFEKGHPRLGEIVSRTTALIVAQVDVLHRIASAFGTYARFPDRKLEPIDLEGLVEEVARIYDGYEERIEVVRRFAGGLPPVRADKDELRRVLVNLFTNAVQATAGKGRIVVLTGRSILARVEAGSEQTSAVPRSCVEVKVIDAGEGIAPENLAKVFIPNFSTKTSGTGLGLAICKKAVVELGGSIALDSKLGHGTTVSIMLPVWEEPGSPSTAPRRE